MGVKGFNKLLKIYDVKPSISNIEVLQNCKICVDIEQLFYAHAHIILKRRVDAIKDAWLDSVKSNNIPRDILHKRLFVSNYIQKELIQCILNRLLRYISNKIYPIVIFDGPVRIEKCGTTSSRISYKLPKCETLFETGSSKDDIKYINNAFMKTNSMYYELKRNLTSNNIVWYVAKNDGEELCAKLDRLGYTWGTLTTDYDYIIFGGTNMITKLDYRCDGKIIYHNCNNLYNKIAPYVDIVKMSVIMGTDFLPKGIHGKGPGFVSNRHKDGTLDQYISKTLASVYNIFTNQSYINEVYDILLLDCKHNNV